ncbi:MAG: A/G-specific adenine glycosylase [Chitinophagaceae bacterium]|nr:A/G-specific adenine glycosylase [Chitinophagaceae bacterium]MCW5928698.1 A/G-specific adenine glycosylase [Chitinophagaceae bacterium]
MKSYFTRKIMAWNEGENTRKMPWKGEKDPYKIWLSEIILQQTRVEQGWSYYLKFIENFPTIDQLAKSPPEKVFKLWEGLGYYSRCRNLIATAQFIHTHYKDMFPTSHADVLALKGVGAYTAAAIVSFAYNQSYAVVDGNVQRVLSRFFGIETPVDSAKGKALYAALAQELLPAGRAGIYNQALMDFGAVVCKPQNPLCNNCPLRKKCIAFSESKVAILPVKEKKIKRSQRWFYYLVLRHKDTVYIRQRTGKDIWQHLYEFVLTEQPKKLPLEKLMRSPVCEIYFKNGTVSSVSEEYKQQLTHQTIHGQFIEIEIPYGFVPGDAFEKVKWKDLDRFAFPKLILTYLKEKNVNLS